MTTLKDLVEGWGYSLKDLGEFRPGAFYVEAMDWLMYLSEDVAYRADPLIIGVVDILWHPYEDRIIGFKVWDASKHQNGLRILKMANLVPPLTEQ